MTKLKKIYLLAAFLFIGTIIPFTSLMAQVTPAGTTAQSCTNSCDAVKCVIGTTNGHLNVIASQNQMKSDCLKREAAKGCFDTVPVSCAGSYAGLGYRPNGAGGNPKPRNHLGSDIGMRDCMKNGKYVPINVYAAADGVVKYVNTGGCSGRTIVIEHTKSCQNPREPNYKSTYRHLIQYKVGVGQSVKKGDVIGIVGGSNAGSIGAAPCDRGEQAGWPGYTTAGCSAARAACGTPNYAIHLHFEVEDGAASASSSRASAAKAMSPNCDNLQVLCGGCPNNASSCGGTGGTFTDGSSASLDGSYSDDTSTGQQTGPECALSKFLDSESCVFCDIFRILFNAASSVAKKANDGLAGPSKAIVGIGFLIWIAVYILRQITNLGGTSPGEMLKGLLFQGFRVAVVILILSNAIYAAMDLTLNPVMQTGLNFMQSLNDSSSCKADAPYMQGIIGYKSGTSDGDGGLSVDLGKSIICSIKNLEDATGFMMGLGKYSICIAFGPESWIDHLFPHFGYLLTGVLLWLAGAFVLLTFPWCLIDCVLQLCIAAALVPCAIAAYAFKVTEKYLKIVWNFFMNSMFNFVFMGIIVFIINSHLKDWIGYPFDDTSPDFDYKRFIEGFTSSGLAAWGIGFLKIAAICFFCMVFFEETGDMAKKFAESPGIGGSKGIGARVGGTMGEIAKSAGGASLKLGANAGHALGRMANSAVGNSVRSGINHIKGAALGILPAAKIRDAQGNVIGRKSNIISDAETGETIGYEKKFRLFGRDFSLKASRDENGVWSTEKTVKKRSATDKAFEQVFDADGNAVKDENGNDVFRYRKRIFGITSGYETMNASRDAAGNLVYKSASGKGQFAVDDDGQISEYKTRFTFNPDNLSTRKLNKVLDENGEAVKDENGNDQYELKHKIFGITFKKETMQALKDENGEIVRNAEGEAIYVSEDMRNSIAMDQDGEISDKDLDRPFRMRRTDQNKQYTAKRVINDSFSKTTQTLDSNGNVVSSETQFNNESSKFLVNKDGTINTHAFNQIKNGAKDIETAATAIVTDVMRLRGQILNNSFKNRTQEIQEDGSIIIKQLNNDGSTQQIHAQIIGDQMIIRNTTTDINGNTTVTKSNGMQTMTELYSRNVDETTGNVSYVYQSRMEFSDYLMQQYRGGSPLDEHGNWAKGVDSGKVMLGFNDGDFKKHVAQIRLNKMHRKLGNAQFNAALNNKDSQVYKLNTLLNAGDVNAMRQLQQLRNKIGENKFNKEAQKQNSLVQLLRQQIVQNSLPESSARIHAGQAMSGGLNVQLSNVELMLGNKEKTLKALEQNNKATTQEKSALQNEINHLRQVQADLKKALGIDQTKPEIKAENTSQTKPEIKAENTRQTKPETELQKPATADIAPRPLGRMSYEDMINEIARPEITPQRLLEMQNFLSQKALETRGKDYEFVYNELRNKATATIATLAAGSLADTSAKDLRNMEKLLDTFITHTTTRDGTKNYADATAVLLKEKIDNRLVALGIMPQPHHAAAEERIVASTQPTAETPVREIERTKHETTAELPLAQKLEKQYKEFEDFCKQHLQGKEGEKVTTYGDADNGIFIEKSYENQYGYRQQRFNEQGVLVYETYQDKSGEISISKTYEASGDLSNINYQDGAGSQLRKHYGPERSDSYEFDGYEIGKLYKNDGTVITTERLNGETINETSADITTGQSFETRMPDIQTPEIAVAENITERAVSQEKAVEFAPSTAEREPTDQRETAAESQSETRAETKAEEYPPVAESRDELRAAAEIERQAEIDRQTEAEIRSREQEVVSQPNIEQEAMEHYNIASEQYQTAATHYQEIAEYEELAANEHKLAAEQSGAEAEQHLRAAAEAERQAELARVAALEAEERARNELQSAQEAEQRAAGEPQTETSSVADGRDEVARTEAENRQRAEEEARQKTEADNKQRAEEEARQKTEADNKQRAEEEARQKAAEQHRKEAEISDILKQMRQEQSRLDDEFQALSNQAAAARIRVQEPARKLGMVGLTEQEKRQLTAEYNSAMAEYTKLRSAIHANRSAYGKATDAANQSIEQAKKG